MTSPTRLARTATSAWALTLIVDTIVDTAACDWVWRPAMPTCWLPLCVATSALSDSRADA